MKKTNRQHIVTIPQQEKNRAYDALIQYAGCLPPDIDYKQEAIEFAVTKYESLTWYKYFEDGLQYQCALEESVDCIITRNKKDFFGSKIPVYTPDEFLA